MKEYGFKRRNAQAFTLVELLVVIGIIAVLISILMPSLSKARYNANRTACMSNLRQIGIAMSLYASENDGWWPCPMGRGGDWGGGAQGSWDIRLLPYLGTKVTWNHAAAELPWENVRPNVFRCPLDTTENDPNQWWAPVPRRSYNINWGIYEFTDYSFAHPSAFYPPWENGGARIPNGGAFRPGSLVPDHMSNGGKIFAIVADFYFRRPNDMAALIGTDFWPGEWYNFVRNENDGDGTWLPTAHPSPRESQKFSWDERNALFSDYHVETVRDLYDEVNDRITPAGYAFLFRHKK